MAGGSNGYRVALVRRQLTPGLISSLPGTAGLPPFIFFSTSYPELDSAVRRPMRRIGDGGRNNAFSVTGAEQQWFQTLPPELKQYLSSIGVENKKLADKGEING